MDDLNVSLHVLKPLEGLVKCLKHIRKLLMNVPDLLTKSLGRINLNSFKDSRTAVQETDELTLNVWALLATSLTSPPWKRTTVSSEVDGLGDYTSHQRRTACKDTNDVQTCRRA